MDLEADHLLRHATKTHIVGWLNKDTREMRYWLEGDLSWKEELDKATVIIGHNIAGYDLPLLKKLFGWTPRPNVKPLTMDHIQREGDDTAFGVKLTLVARKSYSYEEDKMWADQEKKMKTYKDAMVAREKFLQNLVKEAIEAGEEPVISYTTSISITPKPISS
jgi:hypothetical protein